MNKKQPMQTILDQLAAHARERAARARADRPLAELKEKVLAMNLDTGFPFEKALAAKDISFICECKKASPSKGLIAPDFPYVDIARSYEAAGASAISVLTEPKWFQGSLAYLREIASAVSIPVLRKDFVVDEYMIYEAKEAGASAVLLICALLDEDTLRAYRELADRLGLSALVEAHDEQEIGKALRAGARVIGVNNRDLRDFTVDVRNAERNRALVPRNVLFVSESGIRTPQDIDVLRRAHADAALVGETLMRAEDRAAMLDWLRGRTRLKICGLRRPEDIRYANQVRPDCVGFIFDPSRRRYIPPEEAAALHAGLSPGILAAGVFVDAPIQAIVDTARAGTIDLIQLHGSETEAYLDDLRKALARAGCPLSLVQAFRVQSAEDLRRAESSSADLILLDNGAGTGTPFDWTLIEDHGPLTRPFVLAGGLGPENVEAAIRRFRPLAVDASSSLETEGWKDLKKMQAMKDAVLRARARTEGGEE